MRSPLAFWQRFLLVFAVGVLVALPAAAYVEGHDLSRTVREFTAGKRVTWPPAPKPPQRAEAHTFAPGLARSIVRDVRVGGVVLLLAVALLAMSRWLHRRRRDDDLVTYELKLGSDDETNPFRVQEAFEGIAGALSARWYERVWRGQDYFALETHRIDNASIHFTLAAPRRVLAAISGPLGNLYPNVRLVEDPSRPTWCTAVTRLKKRRSYIFSLQTIRNYEHALVETLVGLLESLETNMTVQLVLTPAPGFVHARARLLLKRRERKLNRGDRGDPLDPGMESHVEAKELKGALETQHRSLLYFDLRVAGERPTAVRHVAGVFSQLRSENELVRRDIRVRRGRYAERVERALPNPIPGYRRGILSTSELATLWQLPRARAKLARIPRAPMRRAVAPPGVDCQPAHELMRDERGSVGLAPADRKYGHALIGGQGGGKTSVLARHWSIATNDLDRTVVLIDGKGPFAESAIGMVPAERTVHYLDLAEPEIGFNPLQIGATPGATAAVFVQALIEANPPGAIQAASDSFLRQAIAAVCAVEEKPTLWHVYRMLDLNPDAEYRATVVARLDEVPGSDFARQYWHHDFPALIGNKGWAGQALNPPRNKLERLIATRETDVLLRHPVGVDLAQVIERGEVLVVNAAKAHVGENNARLIMQLLLALLHRQLQAQQRRPEDERRRVTLLFDEAHNVLTPSVATMLAEGRSAGLEAVFAWQYSAQIVDEMVRSGVRSLLQSISIFRMREMEDARSLAGLAMDVYSDHISADQADQERLRFSADDITRLQTHHAINLWVADGTPRPGFVAQTLPFEQLYDRDLADHHLQAQRDRGGHCPPSLTDPLATAAASSAPERDEAPADRDRRCGVSQLRLDDDLEELE